MAVPLHGRHIVKTLSKRDARRLCVQGQLLSLPRPRSIEQVVRELGMIQMDPTSAVARTEHLVLFSRLGRRFRVADLERLSGQARIKETNSEIVGQRVDADAGVDRFERPTRLDGETDFDWLPGLRRRDPVTPVVTKPDVGQLEVERVVSGDESIVVVDTRRLEVAADHRVDVALLDDRTRSECEG